MMTKTSLLALLILPLLAFGQDSTAVFGKDIFASIEVTEENEWGTTDTLHLLYAELGEVTDPILEYYSFQDQGGDCNNLFWMKESLTFEDNQIILLSHYFQKTGIDPIPEWRKRIYVVNSPGELELIYDRYKYYDSDEWVEE